MHELVNGFVIADELVSTKLVVDIVEELVDASVLKYKLLWRALRLEVVDEFEYPSGMEDRLL